MAHTVTDFSRHRQLFNPENFNHKVTILGAGATGSFLVLFLAKLGIQNITVYDFDFIEEHNVPNQAYGMNNIGELKVEALKKMIAEQTGINITVYTMPYAGQRLSGYVFNCVDSMETRKKVWLNNIKMKSAVKHYVEPRIGLDVARVYNLNPMSVEQHAPYEATFYSDDEAEVSACGTSLSVVTSSAAIAGICARQLMNHFNEEELDNEILYDFIYNNTIATKWS